MDEIDQLRSQLELARTWGSLCFLQAFPPKSPPVEIPARAEKRSAIEACGGRAPTTAWRDVPVVVVDTETTGTDAATDRIVELALVFSDGRTWSTLVNPGVAIPPGATAKHGITDRAVASAPTFAEAWSHAVVALKVHEAHPLAYQATFDASFIAAELVRAGRVEEARALVTIEWFDPYVAIRDVDKFEKGKSLEDACGRRGIALEGAHRALPDAIATLALWQRLSSWCDSAPGGASLANVLRWTSARRKAQDEDFAAWQARQRGGRAA
jgi:DNA polymerase-3 subunit epsilon